MSVGIEICTMLVGLSARRGCLEFEFRDLEGLDGLDTRFNTLAPLRGAADIEDACGEYRRPLSFQLGLCSQLPFEVHGERSNLKAKIQTTIYPETLKNRSRKLKNRCLEGVWELLAATLGRKMARRLSWQILADLGQARDAQNGGKMAELGAKRGPR